MLNLFVACGATVGTARAVTWDVATAKPFTAEPMFFAALLVQERDGGWAFVGFRNLESRARLDDEGDGLTLR